MKKSAIFLLSLLSSCVCISAPNILYELHEAMHIYHVPIVGYAVIDNDKIVESKTTSIDPYLKPNKQSLFQSASISKSLTAYAALKLEGENKLDKDKPANAYLKQWRIPVNQFNTHQPILIRHLMDMTSGLTVSGFPGYGQDQELPTYLDILNGAPPANTPTISPFYLPGSKYFYSGGAFQVLQQVITDVTNQSFNAYMNQTLLIEIGVRDSVFEYPLESIPFKSRAVPAYKLGNGVQPVQGGWRNYMCAGACGLWSTPEDLAKFALNISHSLRGKGLIDQKLAKEMLTRQRNTDYGFGEVVNGCGDNLYFWKTGHNFGYYSMVIMFPYVGKGLVVMTNSESGDTLIRYFVALIAQKYNWPYYFPFFDELIKTPAHC